MGRASLRQFQYAPKRLAVKLKMIRKSFALSQTEMCQRLGFKRLIAATISEYESGKRLPPYLVLLRYARIGGVSTDVLLDDKLHIFPSRKPIPKGKLLRFTKKRA